MARLYGHDRRTKVYVGIGPTNQGQYGQRVRTKDLRRPHGAKAKVAQTTDPFQRVPDGPVNV